jgi:hypothetical protein
VKYCTYVYVYNIIQPKHAPSAFHLLPELCTLPLKLLPQVIETPAQQAGSREICGALYNTTPGFAGPTNRICGYNPHIYIYLYIYAICMWGYSMYKLFTRRDAPPSNSARMNSCGG